MNRIPILKKNDERFELDLNENGYKKIHNTIKNNKGLPLSQYVNLIGLNLNEKKLEYALKLFNTYKCSFYGICGPFIEIENKWYIYKNNKNAEKNLINDLKRENHELKQKLNNMKI